MKKILITLFTFSFLIISLFGYIQPSIETKALDVEFTNQALSQTNMNTIQTYLKTNKPNWFSDYKYFVYFTTVWKVLLVPKINNASVIFGNNEIDQPYLDDIDQWRYQITCSTLNPCVVYQFNTNFTFNATYTYTTAQDSLINFNTSFSNFRGETYMSYIGVNSTSRMGISLADYGLPMFPSNWTETWGYTTTSTDYQQTKELIMAFELWGIEFEFNMTWMRDLLGNIIVGLYDVMSEVGDLATDPVGGFLRLINIMDEWTTWSIPVLDNLATDMWDNAPDWLKDPIELTLAILNDVFEVIEYALLSAMNFAILTVAQMTNGFLKLLVGIPASLSILFNVLPDPYKSLLVSGTSITVGGGVIKLFWFVVTGGFKG